MLRIEIFRCAALLVIQKHAFSEKKTKEHPAQFQAFGILKLIAPTHISLTEVIDWWATSGNESFGVVELS